VLVFAARHDIKRFISAIDVQCSINRLLKKGVGEVSGIVGA